MAITPVLTAIDTKCQGGRACILVPQKIRSIVIPTMFKTAAMSVTRNDRRMSNGRHLMIEKRAYRVPPPLVKFSSRSMSTCQETQGAPNVAVRADDTKAHT